MNQFSLQNDYKEPVKNHPVCFLSTFISLAKNRLKKLNMAILVILGQVLAFLAHLVPCPTKEQFERGAYVVFEYVGAKTFANSQKDLGLYNIM